MAFQRPKCIPLAICVVWSISALYWSLAPAFAQNTVRLQGSSLGEAQTRLGGGKVDNRLSQLGYVLADGVVFLPTGSFETGYHFNPDSFFIQPKGSPYGLAESSGVLGLLSQGGATTFAVKGSLLQYDDNILRSTRYDGGASTDNSYTVGQNLTLAFGGYIFKDAINLVPSNTGGGYSQISYADGTMQAATRIKSEEINYLGGPIYAQGAPAGLLPFLQPFQFDVRRSEAVTNFIIGPNAFIGVYAESGGAALEYVSQNRTDVIDRNATEAWVTGGVRLNLTSTVRVDAGWRGNYREFEKSYTGVGGHTLAAYDSGFFDGKAVWTPAGNLQVVLDIDRRLVEPSTAFAIVGDQTTYQVETNYKPFPDFDAGVFARYRDLREVGDVQDYRQVAGGLTLGYRMSDKTSLYSTFGYERTTEEHSQDSYDRVRIGIGTKTKF